LMYKDIVEKTYTFNAPWVAWIETNIESKDENVQKKVEDYKKQLETYKKAKVDNPNDEENFILNVRNNDIVWNYDNENHIWVTSWQVDWFSHFLDSLNAAIKKMSIEEFREKFKMWIEQFNDKE
jgi:sugar-specific transcriptional regulator TrmB